MEITTPLREITCHKGSHKCYLPPGSGDFPAFTPAEAGTRFSDPGGMHGCVDLGFSRSGKFLLFKTDSWLGLRKIAIICIIMVCLTTVRHQYMITEFAERNRQT